MKRRQALLRSTLSRDSRMGGELFVDVGGLSGSPFFSLLCGQFVALYAFKNLGVWGRAPERPTLYPKHHFAWQSLHQLSRTGSL